MISLCFLHHYWKHLMSFASTRNLFYCNNFQLTYSFVGSLLELAILNMFMAHLAFMSMIKNWFSKTMNKTMTKASLVLSPNHVAWKPKTRNKTCKTWVQMKCYSHKYENMNMKGILKGCGARSYLKLMLNNQKVTSRELLLFVHCWGPNSRNNISKQFKDSFISNDVGSEVGNDADTNVKHDVNYDVRDIIHNIITVYQHWDQWPWIIIPHKFNPFLKANEKDKVKVFVSWI